MEFKILAVLSDMDGVVFDSETLWYKGFRNYLSSLGYKYTVDMHKELLGMVGKHDGDFFMEKFGIKGNKEEIKDDAYKEVKKVFQNDEIVIREGYLDFLEYLKKNKIKVALVTQTDIELADILLDRTNLRKHFDVIVSISHVKRKKPFPDCYLKAAEVLGVDIKDCLVIEDSLTGLAAGKSSGARCAAFPCDFTNHLKFEGADVVVKNLKELKTMIITKVN